MNTKGRPVRDTPKDVDVVAKSKFLREITKVAGKPLTKSQASCPIRRVGVRNSLPEFRMQDVCRDLPRMPRARGYRTQSSQTERELNEYEGVVRYPSGREVEAREKKEIGLQVEKMSPRGWGDSDNAIRQAPFDHVKANQSVPIIKPRLTPIKNPDPLRAPVTYQRGIIPKYLQKLKEEEEKHESHVRQVSLEKFRMRDMDLIERAEKLKRISSWHESYKKMVTDLNMLSAAT